MLPSGGYGYNGYQQIANGGIGGRRSIYDTVEVHHFKSFDEYLETGKGPLLDEYFANLAEAQRSYELSRLSRELPDAHPPSMDGPYMFAGAEASARTLSPAPVPHLEAINGSDSGPEPQPEPPRLRKPLEAKHRTLICDCSKRSDVDRFRQRWPDGTFMAYCCQSCPKGYHDDLCLSKQRKPGAKAKYEKEESVLGLCRLASKLHFDMILEPGLLFPRLSTKIAEQQEAENFVKGQRRMKRSLGLIIVLFFLLVFFPWGYTQKCHVEESLTSFKNKVMGSLKSSKGSRLLSATHAADEKGKKDTSGSDCDIPKSMEDSWTDITLGLSLALIPCLLMALLGCITSGLNATAAARAAGTDRSRIKEPTRSCWPDWLAHWDCGPPSIVNFRRLLWKPLLLLWYHHIDVHMPKLKYNNNFNILSIRDLVYCFSLGKKTDMAGCNLYSPVSVLATLTYVVLVLAMLIVAVVSDQAAIGLPLAFAMAKIYFLIGNYFMGGSDEMIMVTGKKIKGSDVLTKLQHVTEKQVHTVALTTRDLKNLRLIKYNSEKTASETDKLERRKKRSGSEDDFYQENTASDESFDDDERGGCKQWLTTWCGLGETHHRDRVEGETTIDGVGIITSVYLEDTQQSVNLLRGPPFDVLEIGKEDLENAQEEEEYNNLLRQMSDNFKKYAPMAGAALWEDIQGPPDKMGPMSRPAQATMQSSPMRQSPINFASPMAV